ncbi:MAG: DUF4330 domain-containing protein [Oscillospiraceae bacterium]
MIDKNGKLFGKINLIDLIIVLIVLALVAFVALKFVGGRNNTDTLTPISMSFYADEIPDFVAANLKEGASVMDSTEDVTLGTVQSFEVGAPLGYETDTDGEIKSVQRKGYNSVTLTITGQAELSEHGATIGGVLYGVGHTLTIYAGQAKLYIKISAIEPAA